MRIYIAHTYGKRHGLSLREYEANTYSSIRYGIGVINKGHNPFIPNLYHFVSEEAGGNIAESRWLEFVTEWLRFCDALFVATKPPWQGSGVQAEIDIAMAMGIPIYWSIEEIPDI